MAAYDGDALPIGRSGNSNSARNLTAQGEFLPMGGGGAPPIVTNYRKRAWRTETPGYVYWDTTDPVGAYPGGGTLDPPLGVILRQWTT